MPVDGTASIDASTCPQGCSADGLVDRTVTVGADRQAPIRATSDAGRNVLREDMVRRYRTLEADAARRKDVTAARRPRGERPADAPAASGRETDTRGW